MVQGCGFSCFAFLRSAICNTGFLSQTCSHATDLIRSNKLNVVNTQVSNFQGNSRMHWETTPQQYSSLSSTEQASPIFLGSSLDPWFYILILNCPLSLPCASGCICQCACILLKTFCDERYYISNGASSDFIFYILYFKFYILYFICYSLQFIVLYSRLVLCSPSLVKPNKILFLKHHLSQPFTEESEHCFLVRNICAESEVLAYTCQKDKIKQHFCYHL